MKRISCALMLLFLCLPQTYSSAQEKKEIVFYNWKDYTDKTILEDFEKKYGIKVILREYETKDMMFSEIQSAPKEFDVIVATDSSVPLLSQNRLLEEMDLTKIPNIKFVKKEFWNPPFDPGNKYSVVAGLWSSTGLIINTNFVPADTDSWSVLWDSKYKGKIALLDESRDAIGAVLSYSHLSVNTNNSKELATAEKNAVLLRDNQVQFGDTIRNIENVLSGKLYIAQTYNGDAVSIAGQRKDIKFIFPKEGFIKSPDNLVISIDSTHKDEAYQLINFLLEPQNVARSANKYCFPPTIAADPYIDQKNIDNPVIYPAPDILQRGEFLINVGEAEGEYLRLFNLLKYTGK